MTVVWKNGISIAFNLYILMNKFFQEDTPYSWRL